MRHCIELAALLLPQAKLVAWFCSNFCLRFALAQFFCG
ncbi:hypothetical protein RNAN_3689 [Rheinheimera nanhaiensis E407-8]|uniref:Uncharacterized protein n=1 Tax=Rheinheimera nanhaiensis E407-8 TaxID=562729 RepID=I1E2Y5_9GAMM|nr:hypothetical protein RNAN_3689 [Rheinheimera nanhaiensis E407-8]